MASKLWGGRFSAGTDKLVEQYTESVSFDRTLYAEDIAGSKAHAAMLAHQGVIPTDDAETICQGLDAIKHEIETGSFEWSVENEDVHMNIEARLIELTGDVGKRLHTGRSRNDQVALAFRLHVDRRLAEWQGLFSDLINVLVDRAEEHADTLLPGYTHLQPAQPVSLGHHLLAYAQMFKRDCERVTDSRKRVQVSPLGAAALAGTTYPLAPVMVAKEVGFQTVFANSMDAVSDRDFVLESLFIASLGMAHLSRMCEEIIIWANPGFGFVSLPDAYATGSSIMPQKKNPDVAEIMRGKTGRVYGDLVSLLTTLKGLPMTYNRDLQEDKEPFFDADETLRLSLALMAGMMTEIVFNPKAMQQALSKGFLNATELADYLVTKGVPFREAHHITGQAVAYAEQKKCGLEDLSLGELGAFSEHIENDVFSVLDYAAARERRKTPGSTGPESVAAQIESLRDWLKQDRNSTY